MKKSFDFEANFVARMKLLSISRHICQYYCEYDLETCIMKCPPDDHQFWIVERLLVKLESEFEEAKKCLRIARDRRERRRRIRDRARRRSA